MAYFTRSRMVLMALEMYDYVEHFREGATDNRTLDLNILIGFQQKALVLGEYLESMGMDYSDIVESIETACNLVYEMAENLDDYDVIKDHYRKLCSFCEQLADSIKNRIIEISNIDIYDFRNLANSPSEAERIERAIESLYNDAEQAEPDFKITMEYSRPLVVGNY